MAQPIDTIFELQQTLDRLAEAESKLNGIPDWMTELDGEYKQKRSEIETLEKEHAEAGTARRTAEAGVADAQERLKKYQQQINAVTNQREYGALLSEIDTTKGQVSTFEASGLAALEQTDKAAAALDAARESFRGIEERYRDEMARWETEKPTIAQAAEGLRALVVTFRERLPKPILGQYDRIRERMKGQAMAPVVHINRVGTKSQAIWHCGVCNFNVRPMVVVEIRNQGNLVQCDSCKRILYVPVAEITATVEA